MKVAAQRARERSRDLAFPAHEWWIAKDHGAVLLKTMEHRYLVNALRWAWRKGWDLPEVIGPAGQEENYYGEKRARFDGLKREWRRRGLGEDAWRWTTGPTGPR